MMKMRASRCLFGPIDHENVQKDLKEKLREITQESCAKWNFDFASDTPMRGYFDWQPDVEIPTFYQKATTAKEALLDSKCRYHQRKRSSDLVDLRKQRDPKCLDNDVTGYYESSGLLRHNGVTKDLRVPRIETGFHDIAKNKLDDATVGSVTSVNPAKETMTTSPFVPVESSPPDVLLIDSQQDPFVLSNDLNSDKQRPRLFTQSNDLFTTLMSSQTFDLSPKSSRITDVRSPKSPSSLNRCKSGRMVTKRIVRSPRSSAKKLRLTPITRMFKTTKLSHTQSREKLHSNL